MSWRNALVRKIQWLSAEEGRTQPTADDWLWTQDKAGRESVDLTDRAAIEFWTRLLRTSEAELIEAVAAVGSSADAIRLHLRRR
jgi:hypothetical protein